MTKPDSNPRIGVLIPTFNRRAYVETALSSVLRQTYARLEVIVIDNGSSDGTAEYMASVRDERVRYVVNSHDLGLAGSVNEGIGRFSADVQWCTVLCDDDSLDPEFVERCLAAIREREAKSVVSSHRVFVDATGAPLRHARKAPPEETGQGYLDQRSRGRRETYLSGTVFHRAAFVGVGGYPVFTTGLASDDALIFALSLRDRLVSAPDAVARIRIHGGAESVSTSDGLRKLETVKEFCAYCRRAAAATPGLSDRERGSIERSLRRYRLILNSFWWWATAHRGLDHSSSVPGPEAARLRAAVREDPSAFSPRIRLNLYLEARLGFDPEALRWYRAAGRLVDHLVHFVTTA